MVSLDCRILNPFFGFYWLAWLFFYVLRIYNDILVVGKCSYDVWDYIFSGRLLEFYATRQHSEPGVFYVYKQRGFYSVIAQYILALWQLPVWLIGKITGKYLYNSIGSMAWLKSLLLLCYFFSGYKIYRIVNKIKNDESTAISAMWVLAECYHC